MAENQRKSLEEIRSGMTDTGSKPKKVKKKEKWWRSLLWAAVVALIIRSFLIEAFRIPTGSMKNSLLVGDYLFVNKLSYYIKTPKYIPFTSIELPYIGFKTFGVDRGDVVVFEFPGNRDEVEPAEKNVNYIKRCIGLPGDTIEIRDKQVYVNGAAMQNPPGMRYDMRSMPKGHPDPEVFPRGNTSWNRDWYGPLRIPKEGDTLWLDPQNLDGWKVFIQREGHTVRLGDNSTIIIDGMPARYYIVKRDYLWMMGDNRDNSLDSRFWGFCPYENVVGSALFIYWSWYNPPGHTGDGFDPEEEQTTRIRWSRILNGIH
jgi:signal peptidase I